MKLLIVNHFSESCFLAEPIVQTSYVLFLSCLDKLYRNVCHVICRMSHNYVVFLYVVTLQTDLVNLSFCTTIYKHRFDYQTLVSQQPLYMNKQATESIKMPSRVISANRSKLLLTAIYKGDLKAVFI